MAGGSCLDLRPGTEAPSTTNIATGGQTQKPGIDEGPKDDITRGGFEEPQSLHLRAGQTKPRHLVVFRPNQPDEIRNSCDRRGAPLRIQTLHKTYPAVHNLVTTVGAVNDFR